MVGEARVLNRIVFSCNYTCVLAALLKVMFLVLDIWSPLV